MRLRVIGEIIKTFEVEAECETESGYDALRFRIELIQNQESPEKITARIWRKEFYRIQPTFPQEHSHPKLEACDELVLVEETTLLGSDSAASTNWTTTLDHAVDVLRRRLTTE